MTSSRSERYRQRAVRHEVRARNYRRRADLLLHRDADTDCAGALLYESAKQCLNALANQRGSNPGTTVGKASVLQRIATEESDDPVLIRNWQEADRLHINSDRGHLSSAQFDESWQRAQAFINSMLIIYRRNT